MLSALSTGHRPGRFYVPSGSGMEFRSAGWGQDWSHPASTLKAGDWAIVEEHPHSTKFLYRYILIAGVAHHLCCVGPLRSYGSCIYLGWKQQSEKHIRYLS
jgi:hypothetical protein